MNVVDISYSCEVYVAHTSYMLLL